MRFLYTKNNLQGGEKLLERFFEILPGLTSWSIILGMILLSFYKITVAATIIIAFYLFWILRLIYMTIFLVLSYFRLRMEQKTDWMERIKIIDRMRDNSDIAIPQKIRGDLRKRLSDFIHERQLVDLLKNNDTPPMSKDIIHLVIFPIIRESSEIIDLGMKSLSRQPFPTNRMVVFFALEERAAPEIKSGIITLEKKYKDQFMDVQTIIHPQNLPGETRVKGANVTYAAKRAVEFFSSQKISLENIIVSCFDADTVVSKDYFSCLTYTFLVTPRRIQRSFQPIPVYHNNIWDVPGFARVIETGSSFFQLIEATNPDKLVTFSSHSMSLKSLVDVGFWPVDMISDDSAIYWKSLIHYDGNYRVVPMYVTVSMDIAGSRSLFKTAKSVYKQKRRWAWGVENFPIVMRAFLKQSPISFRDKVRYGFKLFEGHISWATWGFLLSFIGWFPILIAGREFETSVLYYNAPRISQTIFHLALLSLFVSIILSTKLLPQKKSADSFWFKIGHALEWLAIPFILVIFSSTPSLDAQTRLMLGKKMEFWVANKRSFPPQKTNKPS